MPTFAAGLMISLPTGCVEGQREVGNPTITGNVFGLIFTLKSNSEDLRQPGQGIEATLRL